MDIASSAVTLIDVTVKCARLLKQVKDGSAEIKKEIEKLLEEVELLSSVIERIKTEFDLELISASITSPKYAEGVQNLWNQTAVLLQKCQGPVCKLEELIEYVIGNQKTPGQSKFTSIGQYLRKEKKESEFEDAWKQLRRYSEFLQISLTSVTIIQARQSHQDIKNTTADAAETLRTQGKRLEDQISNLRKELKDTTKNELNTSLNFKDKLDFAEKIVELSSINVHWGISRSVSSSYTGREEELRQLRDLYFAPASNDEYGHHIQKRFVIYGLGGSGKSEFCYKFAQENYNKFWGVFRVDVSSEESAKSTFSYIASTYAKLIKEESDERRAMDWLSQSKLPWLLILDNADDPVVPIRDYFPGGDRGFILITTRNPGLRIHGTIGDGSYRFEKLQEEEGNELLLKEAGHRKPWSQPTKDSASTITRELGCLPLALVAAGSAIRNDFCTLRRYLAWWNEQWNLARLERGRYSKELDLESQSNLIVYKSYEAMYKNLEKRKDSAACDALDLLKMFAFLYRDQIDINIILKADEHDPEKQDKKPEPTSTNPQSPTNPSSTTNPQPSTTKSVPKPTHLLNQVKDLMRRLAVGALALDYTPKVPGVIRQLDQHRLRSALKILQEMSLITRNTTSNDGEDSDEHWSYSMHPLVHTWVRKRPGMTLGEQATWCFATATMLAQAIQIEMGPSANSERDFQRSLHPHIDYLRQCQQEIENGFKDIQEKHNKLRWKVFGLKAPFIRGKALQLVKFSLVYEHNGKYKLAENLQRQALEIAMKWAGPDDQKTMGIKLLLSRVLWKQGQGEKAAEFQSEVLEICTRTLGNDHLMTLTVKNTMGMSLWLQGKFYDAEKLHKAAFEGFKKFKGPEDADTLRAMGHLGRIYVRLCRWDEAYKYHLTAWRGLKRILSESHVDTLEAQDNLAMTYLDRSEYDKRNETELEEAQRLEERVVELRKIRLGEQDPYTLWAQCNLARILACRGDLETAEAIMRHGLKIAKADLVNLGIGHVGTLFGQMHLGGVLVRAGKYKDARVLLQEVAASHKENNREHHPDRLMTLSSLMKICIELGHKEEELNLRDQIIQGLTAINGIGHPWAEHLLNPRLDKISKAVSLTDQEKDLYAGSFAPPRRVNSPTTAAFNPDDILRDIMKPSFVRSVSPLELPMRNEQAPTGPVEQAPTLRYRKGKMMTA